MARKKFNADIKVASEKKILNVSDVRKGESDGEFTFSYCHAAVTEPVHIRILGDIDEYPDSCTFMVFTDSEDVPQSILDIINTVGGVTLGKTVSEIIEIISRKFTSVLTQGTPEMSEDVDMTDISDDAFDEEDDDASYDYEDDDFDLNPAPSRERAPATKGSSVETRRRLKCDLRKARAAGFKVGLLSGTDIDDTGAIFSLSIRVSRLRLPEETLEAWDLKSQEYIVLLMRYTDCYPTLRQFIASSSMLDFLVGKCSQYKPTLSSAAAAFIAAKGKDRSRQSETHRSLFSDSGEKSANFSAIYISNSLERFMSSDFAALLQLRLSEGLSWDGAKDYYIEVRDRGHMRSSSSVVPTTRLADKSEEDSDFYLSDNRTDEAKRVLALDDPEPSIPLHAMHFVVTHLVKCTNYCMVCYRKASHKFEAVKPYVCDIPLCEFQYMELGFGPSVEHEILTQPYVVDLLVSFCYAALQNNEKRGIPKSLHIKVPTPSFPYHKPGVTSPAESGKSTPPEDLDIKSYRVDISLENWTATFLDRMNYPKMKQGDLFVLVSPPIAPGGMNRVDQVLHHCRVKTTALEVVTFTIKSSHRKFPHVEPSINQDAAAANALHEGAADMFLYDKNLEDLPDAYQAEAMMCVLQTLPSVLKMREYLLENPGRRLLSWDQISPSAMTLLRWIIASNRSYIVQLDKPPEVGDSDRDKDITVRTDEKIWGIDERWVQFRFAQGSPTKEERFHQELDEHVISENASEYPTLFAWHGSPLKNWHNIIREGLTFSDKYIAHGRAYGHGVYFSNAFDTSSGYSGGTFHSQFASCWPNSRLKVLAAVSLCEIVNRPDQFINQVPCYVVNRVDWIQCRYLFVHVQQPVSEPITSPSAGTKQIVAPPTGIEYLTEDPTRPAKGPGGCKIHIPESALPRYRRKGQQASTASSPELVELSDEEDAEDLTFVVSDDKDKGEDGLATGCARSSSTDTLMPPDLGDLGRPPTPKLYLLDSTKTSFRPGELVLDTLPKLPAPTWATNIGLRQMSQELSKLQKIQASTPLHELGWYVDFDNLTNIFHWIVELHSFDESLPLAQDMTTFNVPSVVLEVRFGREYPMTPPFVRVIRPRFLPFLQGGGGHVTAGGAMCMELLTNSGWSPANSMESVLFQVRMAMCNTEPQPARLQGGARQNDYGIWEALDAYKRAANTHGWRIPPDLDVTASSVWGDVSAPSQ